MDKSINEVEMSIHNLCYNGQLEAVMNLIDNGTDCYVLDDDERTPLHWASSSKNSNLVEYLLSIRGVSVDAVDASGYTPLMCAVAAGRKDNVVLLVKAGANVNLSNENKESVIHMTRVRTDVLELIIPRIKDINKRNEYGITALMKCCSLGCLPSIELLLKKNADMSLQDEEGNTAAHYAAFDKRRDAYLLLLRNGYDESIRNKKNKTALDYV